MLMPGLGPTYSTAHVKGKRYTRVSRGDPVSYTRVSNCLHAGAMRATRTCDRTRVERTKTAGTFRAAANTIFVATIDQASSYN